MAKAATGEGKIYQRSDGRWAAHYYDASGKRCTAYGKTKREAGNKRREILLALANGTHIEASRFTVEGYLTHWFSIKETTIEASTYTSYHRYMRLHIIPQLGGIKLQALRTDMLQQRVAELVREKKAPRTIKTVFRIFSSALSDALEWKLLFSNPCHRLKFPRTDKREYQVLSEEQAQTFVRICKEEKGMTTYTLSLLALATGMRRGELLALHWDDIDWESRHLKVTRSMSCVKIGGKWENQEKAPKNASSRRTIFIPQFALDALKAHRIRQNEVRLSSGIDWQQTHLCFCTTRGAPFHPRVLHYQFKRILKKAELPDMRFHDLRHSTATILISMGANIKIVQELLGHSDIATTLRTYAHVLPSHHQEAMQDFGALLSH